MKKLPIGKQSFRQIAEGNYLYVDKTPYIYQLLENGEYYFLSRPRRFGKSLLVNTLKEIFLGNKELFRNLWIFDKISWQPSPVIHFSFSSIDYHEKGLKKAITDKLYWIAEYYDIHLSVTTYSSLFQELIEKLAQTAPVAILIDEYDKPIIDNIEDIPKAENNRDILKNFYSIIKDNDDNIRFFFITGVSKFSKVSIFSDLNNLNDITIDSRFAGITGISHEEMCAVFPEHIQALQTNLRAYYTDVEPIIREEYLGYSWDGQTWLYNPFTLLNLFSKLHFGDYWFQTGTPTFLVKMLKQRYFTAFDLDNTMIYPTMLDKFDLRDMSPISLLFQTGYLTIRRYDIKRNIITLGYPNNEVARAFSIHFLAEQNGGKDYQTQSTLMQMSFALENGEAEKFMKYMKALFKDIAYPLIDDKEKYFHSIFYLIIKLLGFHIESEVMTIDGRIDAVMFTESAIFVIEFKAVNTHKAIEQIRDKGYHHKYYSDPRPKILIGIDFDSTAKTIGDYAIEEVTEET